MHMNCFEIWEKSVKFYAQGFSKSVVSAQALLLLNKQKNFNRGF